MTSLFRYILSAILALSLIQSSYARTSTENLIVEESDILGIPKQETQIEEDSFSEEVQTQKRDYAWIVNVKKGPFLTEKKAKQAAFDLNKIINRTIPELKNKVSINWELKLPKNKKISQDKLSWMVNLKFGIYNSKNIALRAVQKIKPTQRIPENVFITRELKDSNVSNLIETTDSKISGKIFFSRELLPEKNKTKEFILVTTNSNSLNVREKPSSSSSVIGKLLKGSKIPHTGNDIPEKRNENWFYVEYSKGKFGWVSSSYTRKIRDSGDSLSTQAKLKTSKTKEKPRINQFEKIKPLATVLQSELDIIKADKAKAIQATNQAKTKAKEEKLASIKEFKNLKDKSSKQIETLLTKNDSLQSELNKIKIAKAKAIQATNQANTKAKEEKLASIQEFENLKDKSSKQIETLLTKTDSLQSELNKIKIDKAKAIQATNQANTKAKEEKLASIKEFKNLKDKSSKQIEILLTKTDSLQSELNQIKIARAKSTQATNQADIKAKEERIASIKEFENLKDKSSKEIQDLKITTNSLQSELNQLKSDKAKSIQATNQATTKAEEEKLASIKEFENLKDKSSKEIQDLKITTNSLQSELNQLKSDKAKSIQATNQANTKVKEERIASIKEFENLKANSSKQIEALQTITASLKSELNLLKLKKSKAIQATNQAKTKEKKENLAIIEEFQKLKAKNSEQIKSLQTTTASLRLELDKATNEKIKAIKTTNLSNTKAKEERLSSISKYQGLKVRSSKEIEDLKTKTDSLTTKLNKTRIDKAKIIETKNQANLRAKEEKIVFTRENNTLKQKISSLRVVLEKFKIEKEKNTQLTNEIKAKTKKESFASIKEFKKLKVKNLKEIQDLKTINASLQSELNKVKTDKAKTIMANNQVILMAKEEKNSLEKKIRSLRVVLDKFKSNKEKDNQLTNQANSKTKEERLASISKYNNLKEKKSEEIKNLKTITASLRSELDKVETDKAKAIKATNQSDTKAKEERLASISKYNNLKEKKSEEIKNLKTITASLRSELDKVETDKAKAIKATNQSDTKAKEERLASISKYNNLKEKKSEEIKNLKTITASLRSELDKVETDKAKAIKATNESNTKAKEERLASISKYNNLKEKKSEEIKNLKTITASLRSELDKVETDKAKAIKATNESNTKAKEERLASISKYNNLKEKKSEEIKNLKTITASLRSELDKVETDKAKAIKATNESNTKAKEERLASISKYNNLKEKKTKEIQALKITTATLKSELNKIKTSKDKAIETAGQASAQIQTERLKNSKLMASLEIKNEKEISNLKEIFDLKIFITSLQSELKKTQVEKKVAINAFDETSAELKTTNSDNIKFTNKLKDTVLFLRKELDNLKVESDKNNREEKIVSSNETDLNSTIKNLRTVLETFKNKKLKTDEATKALDLKLGAERILRDKEISALKKESTFLRLKLDKANLDRVKAIGRINQKIKKPTTGLIPKKEIIDKPTKKQGVAQSNHSLSATDINPTAIVTSNLYNWVKAWESRNTSLYLSFYSKNFKDPKRSLSEWKSYRRTSLKKSSNISIQISNIKIYSSNKKIIRVDFIQQFKSNTTSDIGKKSLVWEKGPDGWKIIKESWSPR